MMEGAISPKTTAIGGPGLGVLGPSSCGRKDSFKTRLGCWRSRAFDAITTDRLTPWQKIGVFALLTIAIIGLMTALKPALAGLGAWGYLGAFAINLLSSATIVLPAPGMAVLPMMVQDFSPLWVGVAAGLGATLGELTGYWAGAQGRQPIARIKGYGWLSRSMRRYGGGILVAFGLIPVLPADVGGLLAGATGYSVRRFLFWVGLTNIAKMLIVAYSAAGFLSALQARMGGML